LTSVIKHAVLGDSSD